MHPQAIENKSLYDDPKSSWVTHHWDAIHPEVWCAFSDRAKELINDHKATRLSAKNIFEHLRRTKIWETKDDVYMLNNSMTPYYARKFEHFNPQYKGYFEKRRRAAP